MTTSNQPYTLVNLPTYNIEVEPIVPLEQVVRLFKNHAELPGVILKSTEPPQIVSRQKVMLEFGTLPPNTPHLTTPLTHLTSIITPTPLTLPITTSIHAAIDAALSRPTEQMYEPILVIHFNKTYRLLDLAMLILSQNQQIIQLEQQLHVAMNNYEVDLADLRNGVKQAEAALHEANMRFRSLVEQPLVGIYIVQDGKFVYSNPKSAAIFGYTPEEAPDWSMFDSIAKGDRSLVIQNISRHLEGKRQNIIYTVRGERKDGNLIDVELHSTRTEYNGKPAVIGVALDITSRRQAERLLDEYNRTLEYQIEESTMLLEARVDEISVLNTITQALSSIRDTPTALTITARTMTQLFNASKIVIALLNEQTNKLTVITEASQRAYLPSLMGLSLTLNNQPLLNELIENGQTLLITNAQVNLKIEATRALLEAQQVQCLMLIPLLARGHAIGGLAIISDEIEHTFNESEIILAETIANQIAGTLENARLFDEEQRQRQMAEQRTQELSQALKHLQATQNQLLVQEKMASLGELTSGIAHEIKNPLNFVNNFALMSIELLAELQELLKHQSSYFTPEITTEMTTILELLVSNAQRIHESGERADSIIRSMLLHSQSHSGQTQKADINTLLRDAINLAYHSLKAKDASFNIMIEMNYDPTLEPLMVMPQDLNRVFVNIVTNACYAADKKQQLAKIGNSESIYLPQLWVSTKNNAESIEIRFRDNGLGIPVEIQDKIFNPFFTTKPAGEGTGLGLSMSYEIIVQGHQGQILVNSVEGEWTEFIINLPKT